VVKTLISLSLLILGVLVVFSVVLGGNLSGTTLTGTVKSDLIVNETTTTIEFTGEDLLFSIDPTIATIAAFVVIGGLAAALGIQILGSGLSPESIKIIITCILYGTLWGLLSILAMPLILSIEVFGTIIYVILLISYIVGVIQSITGGRD